MTTDESGVIKARGTIELADHMAAMRLFYRPRKLYRVLLGILIVCFLVAAIADVLFARTVRGSIPIVVGPLLVWLLLGVILPRSTRKAFDQQKRFHVPTDFEFSATEFRATNEFGDIRLPLNGFVKWRENRDLAILYMNDRMYQIVPKRFFANADDFERFKAHLAAIRAFQ
jgi:hypothetical protein